MNAVRHSPSNVIATFPVSNALVALNSELVYVAKNFSMFEYPYQSTSCFCHWKAAVHPRVVRELRRVPSRLSNYVAPKAFPRSAMSSSSHWLRGTKPRWT